MSAPDLNGVSELGRNLRSFRLQRGYSLEKLGGLSGINKGTLSRVERGERNLEGRQKITDVARALGITVADLCGTPFPPTSPDQSGAHMTVPDVRRAWFYAELEPRQPERPPAALIEATAHVLDLRHQCEYEQVGRALPALTFDAYATLHRGGKGDVETALRVIVLLAHCSTLWLKNLGENDLAYTTADKGVRAAEGLMSPLWLAAAEFARTQALIGLGDHDIAGRLAGKAAEMTPRDTVDGLRVYGTMRLTEAFAAQALEQDSPAAALQEAAEIAERTGPPTRTAEGSPADWFAFGPANIKQWGESMALESGDPAEALRIADSLDTTEIPVKSRLTAHYIDHGRALAAMRGRAAEAIAMFEKAEVLEQNRTRNNIMVRQCVRELLQQQYRAGPLAALAKRMGVDVA